MKKWYIVQTYSSFEKKVAKTLEENTKEINNIKEDVSEIKDMLQQLLSKHGN